MPIDGTTDIPISGTPRDIVADYTLDEGDYFCQNTGNNAVRLRQIPAVVDVSRLRKDRGHPIEPGDSLNFRTEGVNAVYIFTEDGNSTLTITPEP